MSIKKIFPFLLFILMNGCKNKEAGSTSGNIIVSVADSIEVGDPCCYLNVLGDTIVPTGKYRYAGSDTIRSIGFVLEPHAPGWTVINNKGEKLFYAFSFDNGPDYVEEGLFRIVNEKGLMGFADTLGNIVIKPQFAFTFPFQDGKAVVTFTGEKRRESKSEYYYWASNKWYTIDKKGNICPADSEISE